MLTYDWNNRVTSWSKTGSGSEAYHYHPSGWRVYKKPATSGGTLYMYGPSGQLLHEQPDTSSTYPQTEYLYFAGRLLYVTAKPSVSDNWVYTATYTDRLGTVRARGTGTTLTRTSYCPFGEEIATSTNNQYKFASTYRDSTSGLDYAVNRYYASGMGRFLTADPLGGNTPSPQSLNRYAYAGNDPVNGSDPTGMDMTCKVENGTIVCVVTKPSLPDPEPPVWELPRTGPGDEPPDNPPEVPGGGVPEPAPKPGCPDNISSFFSVMVPIANSLAKTWNTDANFILALSAYESGWLNAHNRGLHNPFGLTNAGGNNLNFPSYQAAANYWSKNDGAYIKDTDDIEDFAENLKPHYNSKNPNWVGDLIDVYNSVLVRRGKCGQ